MSKALDKDKMQQVPILSLAFLGDAVYELFIRSYLVSNFNYKSGKLHQLTSYFVNARFQAEQAQRLYEELEPLEQSILRRGRNAESKTVAKNASIQDYRWATGLEALIGYLYLSGEQERLAEIQEDILQAGLKQLKEE